MKQKKKPQESILTLLTSKDDSESMAVICYILFICRKMSLKLTVEARRKNGQGVIISIFLPFKIAKNLKKYWVGMNPQKRTILMKIEISPLQKFQDFTSIFVIK